MQIDDENNNRNGRDIQAVVADDREELFPDEECEIVNTMDVTRKLWVIAQIEKQIAQYELQDRESRAYYADREAKCEQRIEFMKRNILGFLQFNNLTNLQTPNGTAYQKAVTTKHWPSDDILIAWALAYKPEAIRIKREPDKKAIAEHIHATGETPDGYSEVQETRLYLQLPRKTC